ncbi:MAG: TIGR01777 family oxidoreductase [Phycisphaerales bacterium]
MEHFTRTSVMPAPAADLYAWHARPGAFERLMPPWERLSIVSRTGSINDGDRLVFKIHKGPLGVTWEARHANHASGRRFDDVMVRGPFASWRHAHHFQDGDTPESSVLRDEVSYALPLGAVGRVLGGQTGRAAINRMFDFRHERTRRDLERHRLLLAPLRVVMTGASGAIGRELVHFLTTGGHVVERLVRRPPGPGEIFWQPGAGVKGGQIDDASMEACDAVIHLAGEPIAPGRWTEAKKRAIRDSRVEGTRLMARTVASLKRPPATMIVASGVHYYGDRGEQELTEESGIGSGFLAEVTRDWEAAVAPAVEAGVRVVMLRIGLVLSPRGGLLTHLLPLARMGLLPIMGTGRQWWSWIGQDDLLGLILHTLADTNVRGPVNAVTPRPVRMHEFAAALAAHLKRPVGLRAPAFMVRGMVGEMADVVLTSTRAVPEALRQTGFTFQTPGLAEALAWELDGAVR